MAKSFAEMRQELTENFSRQIESVNAFHARFPETPNIVKQLEEMHHNVSTWWGAQYGGTLSCTIGKLDSFKEPMLLDILELLETHYNMEFVGVDYPSQMYKRFTAHITWNSSVLDITVEAHLANDAKGCTRVQVGVETKTVETPIYRLDCQGEEHVD